jgi:hypothetical protein
MSANWQGTAFCTPSTATERLGRQADWVVNGVTTNVPVTDFGNYFQLHFAGNAGSGLFVNGFWGPSVDPVLGGTGKFFIPSTAANRLYTIEPQATGPYQNAVGPSFQAVQAQPELVAEPGVRGVRMFVGSNYYHGAGVFMAPSGTPAEAEMPTAPPIYPSFLIPSTSKYRLYQRYAVYDPTVTPLQNSPATMFMGYGRFGIAAFTAEVNVFMPSLDCPEKFRISGFTLPSPSNSFTMPHNSEPMEYVASAVEAARKMIDKVLLRTGPVPIFVAGEPFIMGVDDFIVGQAEVSN